MIVTIDHMSRLRVYISDPLSIGGTATDSQDEANVGACVPVFTRLVELGLSPRDITISSNSTDAKSGFIAATRSSTGAELAEFTFRYGRRLHSGIKPSGPTSMCSDISVLSGYRGPGRRSAKMAGHAVSHRLLAHEKKTAPASTLADMTTMAI